MKCIEYKSLTLVSTKSESTSIFSGVPDCYFSLLHVEMQQVDKVVTSKMKQNVGQ